MYHNIEFTVEFMVDLDTSGTNRLERILVRKGTRFCALVKPYIFESRGGPLEVADLSFKNGSTIRKVPFAFFFFVE